MCGIFGIFTKDGRISGDLLENAARSLSHRGPDDSGTVIIETSPDGNHQIGFAQTRLSIIDLSPQGHQPMHQGGNVLARGSPPETGSYSTARFTTFANSVGNSRLLGIASTVIPTQR